LISFTSALIVSVTVHNHTNS